MPGSTCNVHHVPAECPQPVNLPRSLLTHRMGMMTRVSTRTAAVRVRWIGADLVPRLLSRADYRYFWFGPFWSFPPCHIYHTPVSLWVKLGTLRTRRGKQGFLLHVSVFSPFFTVSGSRIICFLLSVATFSTPRHCPWQGHVSTSD